MFFSDHKNHVVRLSINLINVMKKTRSNSYTIVDQGIEFDNPFWYI